MSKRACGLTALLIVLAVSIVSTPSFAQSYPVKPVRVIIGFAAGGGNDVVGRIAFQRMSEQMGQQFMIDNRPGGSGSIAAAAVAKLPPDGYTLMVHSATHLANAFMYQNLPYDTLRDFAGITSIARQVAVLVVHPSLPANSVKEFITLARKRPGDIAYATAGNGSMQHLTMALINSMTDTKMLHVPYKGGGPANTALMSGEIHATITTIGSVIPQMASKKLRPLGVTSDKRLAQFPDIPAIAESIPGYELTAWIGAFAPAGTPASIVDRLNAELKKALEHPETSRTLVNQALDPMHMTSTQFEARLKSDYEKYGKLIRASVKPQ